MRVVAHADWSSNPSESAQLEGAVWTDHVAVAADARIDNAAELRSALKIRHDASVAEVLAHAYLAWGEEISERLTGDFAFILWDERQRRLLATRDPFGVRPLFYRSKNDQIWFANRVGELVETFHETPAVDDQRVTEYLLGVHAGPERTFFREIREVPPGSVLIASSSGIVRKRYWSPQIEPNRGKVKAEYGFEFQRLFIQSVERRLHSTGPVMIHVSGGLDSSAIACSADFVKRARGSNVPSIMGVAGSYPGLKCDESTYIDAVARQVIFPIERWDQTRSNPADLVDPNVDRPGIRTIFRGGTTGDIAIARANGGSVILSGLGGDQLGIVEGFIKDLISNHKWRRAIGELIFFPGASMWGRVRRTAHLLQQFLPDSVMQLRAKARRKIPNWLTPDAQRLAAELVAWKLPPIAGVSNLQRYTWKRIMSAETLRNVSMMNIHALAYQMEYRFPFLDKDLVLFVLSIPYEFWPPPGPYARLHREALASLLPGEISGRFGKAEFTPAVVNRVRQASHLVMALFEGAWVSSRYVERDAARRFCQGVLRSDIKGSAAWRQVWAIATLEAWMRKNLAYSARREGKRSE